MIGRPPRGVPFVAVRRSPGVNFLAVPLHVFPQLNEFVGEEGVGRDAMETAGSAIR